MSSIIYNKAFNINLRHLFYTAAVDQFLVNKDLEIAPTNECLELFRQGRMRYVPLVTGGTLFYKRNIDNTGALVPLTGAQSFVFAMRFKSDPAQFLNVTNLDQGGTYAPGKKVLLEGTAPASLTLTASLIDRILPTVSTYSFIATPPPVYQGLVNVTVTHESGSPVITLLNVPFNATTGTYSVELDFTGKPLGKYNFQAVKVVGGGTAHDAVLYVDSNLAREDVFGIIRLKYTNAADLYNSTKTFSYSFVNRSTLWRYYLVAKTIDTTVVDLAVIDGSLSHTFTPVDPTVLPYGSPNSLVKINGYDTIITTSSVAIPYTDVPLTELFVYKRTIIGGAEEKIQGAIQNAVLAGVDSDRLGAAQPVPTITDGIAEIFIIL